MRGQAVLHEGRFRHVVFASELPPRDLSAAATAGCGCRKPSPVPDPAVPNRDHDRSLVLPRSCRPAPAIDPDGERLLHLVLAMAGLPADAYRAAPLHRRLPACLRALGTRSPLEAAAILARCPDRLGDALDALLIGVTSVFRDPPLFGALRRIVVPALLALGRPPRVLSVGCSDGAELYSVAMLILELGGPGALEAAELLGTDCRPSAVSRAAAGRIQWRDGVGPGAAALRYLEPDGRGWRVAPDLREAARFVRADALSDPAAGTPGGFDLVLCRNLAIYLSASAVPLLWERLLGLLNPAGYLAVGKAERVRDRRLRALAPCLYMLMETSDAR